VLIHLFHSINCFLIVYYIKKIINLLFIVITIHISAYKAHILLDLISYINILEF